MLLWPTVTLIGFVVLTGFVIAMGTSSTARYEREQRAADRADAAATEPSPTEPIQIMRAA